MKKTILMLTVITASIVLTSCKKDIYGCTDPNSLNYSSEATKSDGSCVYSADLATQNIFIEEFNVSMSTASPYDTYYTSFTKEAGDIIVMEVESDNVSGISYWTAMPYSIGNDILIWGEYSDLGACWVYSSYVNSGSPAQWNGTATLKCRVALIKHSGLILNPELSTMTITELSEL